MAWAAPFGAERTWAVESASGLGKLLAQQLAGVGEHVIDVPPTLSARVRLLGSAKAAKNEVRVEDYTAVIRLLIDRYDDLVSLRTQAACRLHVPLRELIAGGAPTGLSADRAAKLLRTVRPDNPVAVEDVGGHDRTDAVELEQRGLRRVDRLGDPGPARRYVTVANASASRQNCWTTCGD